MRFDLVGLADDPIIGRNRRIMRWLASGMAGLAAFLLLYAILGYDIQHHGFAGWTPGLDAALAAPGSFLLVCIVLILLAGPGASSVEVDQTGVIILRPNGRRRQFLWRDPLLHITIELTNGVNPRGGRDSPRAFIRGYFPAQTYLSREAYEAIVREARARAARVTIEPSPAVVGWTRVTVTSR